MEDLLASLVAQMVKNPAFSAKDAGSIPGLGRSPGEGKGYLSSVLGLENSMDRRAWWATVHGVSKSWQNGVTNTFTLFLAASTEVIEVVWLWNHSCSFQNQLR